MTLSWDHGPALNRLRQGAQQGVIAATEMVHAEGTRRIANPPKTGRIYIRRGVAHQASAPGQSPATDTGALIASGSTRYDFAGTSLAGWANWSAFYAPYLEFGTIKMAPRPFARPALDFVAPQFQGLLVSYMRISPK